jgi:RNA polymerase sigma-70 factor (ECF subfamily)
MPMWPNAEQTDQLLAQARQGDSKAIAELLANHREALRRMVGLRLDPVLARRVDASDIVQDVLIEANRRLPEYLDQPRMPFHLWLRHLARDQMIDAHRRHRQAKRRSLDREQSLFAAGADDSAVDLLGQLLDPEQTPASAALRQELQARLEQAINRLSPDDREIILMRHHEQLSNQDVARALSLSEAAASMRYLRALRRLRKVLISSGDSTAEAQRDES